MGLRFSRLVRAIGVGLYIVVTRTLMTVAVVFTVLFFVLNSSPFPDLIAKALVGVIPGSFEFGRIQVSPIPWIVDVTDVAIKTPGSKAIITSDLVRARIRLVPLFESLLNLDRRKLLLHFASVKLDGFNVLLQFDDDYHLELVDAFYIPDGSPPNPNPFVVALQFDHIEGTNGHAFVEFPEWDVRLDGIDMKTNFQLVSSPIGILVRARYFNWMSGIAHVRAAPESANIPRTVALRQGFIDDFVYDWDEIAFGRFRAGFDFGFLDASDGYLSWGRNLKYELAARLDLPEGSHAVRTATGGSVTGPISVAISGSGDRADPRFQLGVTSPALRVGPVDLGQVDLSMTGGRDGLGFYGIRDIEVLARSAGLKVDLSQGEFIPDTGIDGEAWNASGMLDFSGVDVAGLIRLADAKISSAAIPVPGLVEGSLRVGASGMQPVASAGDGIPTSVGSQTLVKASGKLSGALSRKGVLDGRTFSLEVDGEASWRDIFSPVISFSRLRLKSGIDQVAASGMVDLASGKLAVSGSATKELSSLAPLVGARMEGVVDLAALKLRGRISSPTGSARVAVSDFAFDRWKVFQASAAVSLSAGMLSVADLKAATPFGQFMVDSARMPLSFEPSRMARGSLELSDIVVKGLDLQRFPLLAGTGISGFGHVRARSLSFGFKDIPGTLSSMFSADIDWLLVAGRRLETVSIQGSMDTGVISGLAVDAAVSGGGNISVSGTWDLRNERVDMDGSVSGVPLAVLAGLGPEAPVTGKVSADINVSGILADPDITGGARLDELTFRGSRLAPVRLQADRTRGGDLFLKSDKLFGGMKLGSESRITWKDGGFRSMTLEIDIKNLTPQDLLPNLAARKLSGSLTARLLVEIPSFSDPTVSGRLESPPDGFWLEFFNRQARIDNRGALSVRMEPDGSLIVSGLRLDDGQSEIETCGTFSESGLSFLVRGSVGMHWLRAFRSIFSSADGLVQFAGRERFVPQLPGGCTSSMLQEGGALLVSGAPTNPVVDGTIRTGQLTLNVRSLGDPVRIEQGGEIELSRGTRNGRPVTGVLIPDQHWISGVFGEGVFNLSGRAVLDSGLLDDGLLRIKGSQLRYVSPGEFFVVAEPRLQVDFRSLRLFGAVAAQEEPSIGVSGQVDISDGAYHRNFNVVRSAFSGLTGGRVAERSGRSIFETAPWLGNTRLSVAVRAPSFGVRTRLVVGQTDLDLNMNLRLLGTLRYPEIWDRIEVVSGGSFTYDVVRRDFEVTRGVVDFDGDVTRPQIDLQAKTRIEYKSGSGSTASASRFNADDSQDSFYSDMIQVNLAVSGTYPELDIQVTSPTRGLSQNDLQVLLLTGIAPGDSIGESGGSFVNVNLLTGSVTDSLVKVLLSDLVDSVSFGVSAGGDVNLDVSAHMGRRLKVQTQVQQGSGTAQYSTGFKIMLTEGLSLEGRLRAVEYSVDQEDVGRNYDTKLRYRIPID
ncbi:MAG TPA: hypothetical protein PLB35_03985 [Myxococcota bacterium]|nr:hypothetical protein [Myxococcota bacterium]HOH76392.1 hypothetical protein [Myxococcota bacterium]